jgi:Lrp/AsnC family transcriptional regulator
MLDATDKRIICALQQNPDLSVAEIGEWVGLSSTPCWRRIKRMETEGIITGRALMLDPKKLGLGVSVFASVKLKQHDEETLERFESAAIARDEIVECFIMGGDSDYLLRIVVGDIEEYEHFLKKVLLHLPAVGAVNSSFALKCVKLTTKLPIGG